MARVSFDPGNRVRGWQRRLENPSAALKQIGVLMVSESQRSFKEQRFGRDEWQPRRVPNVFGIIADFAQGKKSPPGRRFEDRPALRDTGRLTQSISYQLVNLNAVEVGTNLPYAVKLHAGGTVKSESINEQVQTLLAGWLKRGGKKWLPWLGWLTNPKMRGRQIEAKLPARPFVGITKETLIGVRDAIGVRIFETGAA